MRKTIPFWIPNHPRNQPESPFWSLKFNWQGLWKPRVAFEDHFWAVLPSSPSAFSVRSLWPEVGGNELRVCSRVSFVGILLEMVAYHELELERTILQILLGKWFRHFFWTTDSFERQQLLELWWRHIEQRETFQKRKRLGESYWVKNRTLENVDNFYSCYNNSFIRDYLLYCGCQFERYDLELAFIESTLNGCGSKSTVRTAPKGSLTKTEMVSFGLSQLFEMSCREFAFSLCFVDNGNYRYFCLNTNTKSAF